MMAMILTIQSNLVKSLMPDATYLHTGKFDHAWPNWRAGAKAAKSEFVAWLQDDDKVKPNYSIRIIEAFDRFPDANVWYARLVIAIGEGMAIWNCGNGPWVPVDLFDGKPYSWAEGSVLVASAYFTSWSLAPAFAFRNNAAFRLACDRMPENCDIFVERLIPALTCNGGPFIADPTLAGYWMQHDEHLSTKQHKDQPRMTKVLIAGTRPAHGVHAVVTSGRDLGAKPDRVGNLHSHADGFAVGEPA